MVLQKPNPFPKSIYENVAYGLRLHGANSRVELDEAVERAPALIEELLSTLKRKLTIVTHNMQQAARVSDFTAYMYLGAATTRRR
jgi:phosphate transport system ATP-binding protein